MDLHRQIHVEKGLLMDFSLDEKPCCTKGIRCMFILCQTAGIIFVQWQKHEFLPSIPFISAMNLQVKREGMDFQENL